MVVLQLREQRVFPGRIALAECLDVWRFTLFLAQAELLVDQADDTAVSLAKIGKAVEVVGNLRRLASFETGSVDRT